MSIAFDNARPSRAAIEPVALDLIRRRGSEVLGIARRYTTTPDDAEDAYQRALEILLTKAPTTREDELWPWLKTVVRHECFALRKKRERYVPVEHEELDAFASAESHAADVRAERYDRLRVGAEALRRLKPQETRALLLKAEGMSYQEIAARTGWSYTKVNRCLTEGRRAFFARVEGIESGAECERLDPLLSAMADGEATAEDMAALRPHLRGCPSCRATLRDYRQAPSRVAAIAPTAGVLAWLAGRFWSGLRSLVEAAVTQKAALAAASTVAIAGGGAATMHAMGDPPPQRSVHHASTPVSRPVAQPAARPVAKVNVVAAARRLEIPVPRSPARRPAAPARRPAPASRPDPQPAKPATQPSPEPAAVGRVPVRPAPDPRPGDAGQGEFGP